MKKSDVDLTDTIQTHFTWKSCGTPWAPVHLCISYFKLIFFISFLITNSNKNSLKYVNYTTVLLN